MAKSGSDGKLEEAAKAFAAVVEKTGLSNEYSISDSETKAPSGQPEGHARPRATPLPYGAAFEVQRARVLRSAANYTRFVRTLKILLPLSAFAVVAATMMLVLLYDADDTLTLSFTAVEHVDNDLRMVNPRFSGVDDERRPFLVTAVSATQDAADPRIVVLEVLQADMTLGENAWISMSADHGTLDTEAETLVLEGDITLFSDTGYEFHTQQASVFFDQRRVVSNGAVAGQGPLGTLRADGLITEDAGERLRFEGNVRMRIYPPQGRN